MKFIEVNGDSMKPTLIPHQILICTSITTEQLQRGQILTFLYQNKLLIKRLVGLPGDHIIIRDDTVFLNGEVFFTYTIKKSQYYEFHIAPNQLCVIGDNPHNSLDSRRIGLIQADQVVYRIRARIWPPRLF